MLILRRILVAVHLRIVCAVALVAIDISQASAETELAQFFPSMPIHEDDRLDGNFEAVFSGCIIKLTETSKSFVSVHTFDVLSYETNSGRLSWPYAREFSTRYNVPWFLRTEVSQAKTNELNAQLWNLRISWRDRRTLGAAEVRRKSEVLQSWLSEIRSGRYGSFAQKNYTARYQKTGEELLVSVLINNLMNFPVQRGDMPSLAHAMYRHSLACHRE